MTPVVVFDLAGVICHFRPERRLDALSAATGLSGPTIDAAIWQSGLDERAERGELTPTVTLRAVLQALESRIDKAALLVAWATAFELDGAVARVVRQVKGQRFILTNNGPLLTDCLADELKSVSDLVERVICSWELGVRKPNEEAFFRLTEELRSSPGEITFIDDTPANCEAAERVGLRAVHFEGVPTLLRQLRDFNLLNP